MSFVSPPFNFQVGSSYPQLPPQFSGHGAIRSFVPPPYEPASYIYTGEPTVRRSEHIRDARRQHQYAPYPRQYNIAPPNPHNLRRTSGFPSTPAYTTKPFGHQLESLSDSAICDAYQAHKASRQALYSQVKQSAWKVIEAEKVASLHRKMLASNRNALSNQDAEVCLWECYMKQRGIDVQRAWADIMLEPKPIVAEPVPSSDGTTGDLDFANAKYSTETGDSGDENLEEYAEVDDPEEDGSEDEIDHEDSECTGW